jgi:hypothetical protein
VPVVKPVAEDTSSPGEITPTTLEVVKLVDALAAVPVNVTLLPLINRMPYWPVVVGAVPVVMTLIVPLLVTDPV